MSSSTATGAATGCARAHVVLLSAKGYSLDQAADALGVDRDAVSRWLPPSSTSSG